MSTLTLQAVTKANQDDNRINTDEYWSVFRAIEGDFENEKTKFDAAEREQNYRALMAGRYGPPCRQQDPNFWGCLFGNNNNAEQNFLIDAVSSLRGHVEDEMLKSLYQSDLPRLRALSDSYKGDRKIFNEWINTCVGQADGFYYNVDTDFMQFKLGDSLTKEELQAHSKVTQLSFAEVFEKFSPVIENKVEEEKRQSTRHCWTSILTWSRDSRNEVDNPVIISPAVGFDIPVQSSSLGIVQLEAGIQLNPFEKRCEDYRGPSARETTPAGPLTYFTAIVGSSNQLGEDKKPSKTFVGGGIGVKTTSEEPAYFFPTSYFGKRAGVQALWAPQDGDVELAVTGKMYFMNMILALGLIPGGIEGKVGTLLENKHGGYGYKDITFGLYYSPWN